MDRYTLLPVFDTYDLPNMGTPKTCGATTSILASECHCLNISTQDVC